MTQTLPTVGAEVEPVVLRLTVQRLVMIAGANRDFAPIHHDGESARRTGAEDAYTNMMFIMAMLERAALATAGPGAQLVALRNLRMTAFNRAGDTVTCRGIVREVENRTLVLDLWLESDPGRRTASAVAVLGLP